MVPATWHALLQTQSNPFRQTFDRIGALPTATPSSLARSEESAPKVLEAWAAAIQRANSGADALFYDVGALSAAERADLAARDTPEGHVLLVPPSGRTNVPIATFDTVEDFDERVSEEVDAVAIAGVGSSALGCAALARNVADALDRPVLGIVSGLGMTDILLQSLGGWFLFGYGNELRQRNDAFLERHAQWLNRFGEAATLRTRAMAPGYLRGSPDSRALWALLSRRGDRIRHLVGHSKGCLSIANALFGYVEEAWRRGEPVPDLSVTTFGAAVYFPDAIADVVQYLGKRDALGALNSRDDLPRVPVPDANHHTNTEITWLGQPLDVTRLMRNREQARASTAVAPRSPVSG